MRTHRACFALTSLLPFIGLTACSAGAQETTRGLAAELEAAVMAHVENEMVPGVSVAVVRGADTLLMGGYGYVDLEATGHTHALLLGFLSPHHQVMSGGQVLLVNTS